MTEYKEVTPQDILDAAERNGYGWHRMGWFNFSGKDKDFPITEACILGQVALNLEIDHHDLSTYLSNLDIRNKYKHFETSSVYSIATFNDDPGLGIKTYKGLVTRLRTLMKPHMNAKPLKARVVKRYAKKSGEA